MGQADSAREAADVATDAALQADKVQKVAREAEQVILEQQESDTTEDAETLLAIQEETTDVDTSARTQAAQMDAATKQLITDAEDKAASDEPAAAALARRAAVNLLGSSSVWTRQSAGQALSGTDDDMLIWLASGRVQAQEADDRESLLHFAQIGTAKTAATAETVLAQGHEAIKEYLTNGILQTQRDEFRIQTLRVMEGAGPGVTAASSAALNDGSASALSTFLAWGYPKALADDERVETLRILENGGPYVQAAARNCMAGPAWMRSVFVTRIQYRQAQADEDTDAHVAAVQAQVSIAAKAASTAHEDANRASEAAARARGAAAEAEGYADAAEASAKEAGEHADRARASALAADASAERAATSAQLARTAAATARKASRAANYSAKKATASAVQASNSAASAASSANKARAAAIAAGKDANAANQAAREAYAAYLQKDQAEHVAKAKKAREEAERNEADGYRPQDDSSNDDVEFDMHDNAGIPDGVRDVVGFFSLRGGIDAVALTLLGRHDEAKESFMGFIGPFFTGQVGGTVSKGSQIGPVTGVIGRAGVRVFGWPAALGATVVDYLLPKGGPVRYIAPGPFDRPAQPPITR
ncbi:hypothetical protein AAH978_07535 [Streptomyces sp. ZYX-F-203]